MTRQLEDILGQHNWLEMLSLGWIGYGQFPLIQRLWSSRML